MTATATELYTGKYGIMDTDGHIVEPADLWTGELMEAKYKGRGLQSRAHGAEGRAPEHRSREAQRAACRSAAGWRSRQALEAASAESEGP